MNPTDKPSSHRGCPIQPPLQIAFTLALSLSCLSGCVDAKGRFEEFLVRRGDAGPSVPIGDAGFEDCILPTPEQAQGEFLLSFLTPLAPGEPILMTTDLSVKRQGMMLEGELVVHPLSQEDGSPVGEQSSMALTVIKSRLQTEITTVPIPGAGNPVGVDVVADMALNGRLCVMDETTRVDAFCGIVEGQIVRPITAELVGSTFAAVRINDPDNPPAGVSSCEELAEL